MPSISNGLMPNSMPTITRMMIAPPPRRMPPNGMPPPPALSGALPVRSSTFWLRRKSPHRMVHAPGKSSRARPAHARH